jgi:putative ABC transport system permease protein
VPGVAEVLSVHFVLAKVGDKSAGNGVALSGPIEDVFDIDILEGSGALPDNGMLVSDTESDAKGWRLGDTVTLTSNDGEDVPVQVSGIYKTTGLLGSWVVSEQAYQQITPENLRSDFLVLVNAAPDVDPESLRAPLEQATDPFVIVQVQDRDEFKGAQAAQIDTLLAVLYGLLALAVVIAILGIVNTLALSVVERRREIGMLRAVGMYRNQVRRAIYLESMLIAVFGALVGVLLGLGIGSGFIRTLRDQGLEVIAVPWAQVVTMLVGSALVGVLAALWPAVRAARIRPLEAIVDV